MTQEGLAKKSGVSKSMISAIENQAKHPTIPILHELAHALKVPLCYLFSMPLVKTMDFNKKCSDFITKNSLFFMNK